MTLAVGAVLAILVPSQQRPVFRTSTEAVQVDVFVAIAGVTLGASGCVMLSREEGFLRVEALSVEAVDTTGAGDVIHGAFLHVFLKTASVESAARFANVAAARKCEGMTG